MVRDPLNIYLTIRRTVALLRPLYYDLGIDIFFPLQSLPLGLTEAVYTLRRRAPSSRLSLQFSSKNAADVETFASVGSRPSDPFKLGPLAAFGQYHEKEMMEFNTIQSELDVPHLMAGFL